MLVGGVGAAGLGWLRVVIDLLWRESAAGGGFLVQVHACGGGGGGGRGLNVNWLCGLPGMSETTQRGNPGAYCLENTGRALGMIYDLMGLKDCEHCATDHINSGVCKLLVQCEII